MTSGSGILSILFELMLAVGLIQGDPVLTFTCPIKDGESSTCYRVTDWDSPAEKWYRHNKAFGLCGQIEPKTEMEPCDSYVDGKHVYATNYYQDLALIKALDDKNHPLKRKQSND